MPDMTLAEVTQQIDMFEAAEEFAAELQQFTDFLTSEAGGNITKWISDDKSVQFELDQLKNAALKFSETLQAAAKVAEPLTTAASTAGNINTAVKTVLTFAQAVEQADQSSGAEKATQLADVISGMTNIAQVLTGLSLNPVIGVFLGLYAVALQNAAIGLAKMDAYAARRNEMINSRGEFDLEAAIAEQQAAAERAEDERLELARQLDELYAKRGELIAGLQAGQYRVALDYCASRNRDALSDLISKASEHGGIVGNAAPNGDSLERVEEIVSELAGASFDLMMQAAAAPEGSEARADLVERAEDLLDTKHELTEGLGPFRDCVTETLERYGYSTADAGSANSWFGLPRRMVLGGGGGILAMAMVGVVIVFGGGSGGGSGPWATLDPRNDFAPSFTDGQAIEDPSAVGDVTHMRVEVSGGGTTVTVTFAGDAQSLQNEGGEELSAALQFIPVGDERFIDMLLSEDGSVKISDPPAGASISTTWTAPNVLVFQINGLTPASGATVRFATIQRLGFGHSTDEVDLVTNGSAAVPTAPEPDATSKPASAGLPVLVAPCSVINQALASSLLGATIGPPVYLDELDNARFGQQSHEKCRYEAGPTNLPTATLQMEIVLGPGAAQALARWRNSISSGGRNDGGQDILPVAWSEEGEQWSLDFNDISEVRLRNGSVREINGPIEEHGRASLWAVVIASNAPKLDLFIEVYLEGLPGTTAAEMATVRDTIAERLRDAILEAQP